MVYGNAKFNKSPLQIQGTKHFININFDFKLQIGCKCFDLDFWKDNFKKIGESEGYSEIEILEYEMYIDLAIKLKELQTETTN